LPQRIETLDLPHFEQLRMRKIVVHHQQQPKNLLGVNYEIREKHELKNQIPDAYE
jgi:hypothetical protein